MQRGPPYSPLAPEFVQDPYWLNRFVQAPAPVFEQVASQLRAGAKRSHWMWFIFAQLPGLGHSDTARHFAIRSMAEAQTYLRHHAYSHGLPARLARAFLAAANRRNISALLSARASYLDNPIQVRASNKT